MFRDAMLRKGMHVDNTQDIPSIVAIHNIVNEQAWQHVRRWEKLRPSAGDTGDVALLRFLGRPDTPSPRAWFRSTVLGYRRPFDRHDWYVARADGTVRRYVIDFYAAEGDAVAGGFHLDVRPALDSLDAVCMRCLRFCIDFRDKLIKPRAPA